METTESTAVVKADGATAPVGIMPDMAGTLQFAKQMIASGFLPKTIDRPAKALAIMQVGRELGLPPMMALSHFYVIGNKVSSDAQMMLAVALKSGKIEPPQYVERSDTRCVLRLARTGGKPQEFTFTIDDARRLGVAERNKANYQSQPRVMLQWRCLSEALRAMAPDALGGLYTHEEMGLPVRVEGDNMVLDGDAVMIEEARAELTGSDVWDAPQDVVSGDGAGGVESGQATSPAPAGDVPKCPMCDGDMWDNRNDGGKIAFKCKQSKWNKATRTEEGCPGVIWMNQWEKHPEEYLTQTDDGDPFAEGGDAPLDRQVIRDELAKWYTSAKLKNILADALIKRGEDGKPIANADEMHDATAEQLNEILNACVDAKSKSENGE